MHSFQLIAASLLCHYYIERRRAVSKRTRETILDELEREQIRLADLERQVRASTVKKPGT